MKKIFKKKWFKKSKKINKKLFLGMGIFAVAAAIAIGQFGASPFKSKSLSYEEARFARVDENGEAIFLEKNPTFEKGEPVTFALMNVGTFERGEDGLHFVDMDLTVKGPEGEIVLTQESLLGAGGHVELEGGVAPSPNGVFVGAYDLEPGKYTMELTVYDKISGAQVSEKGVFILEAKEWADGEEIPVAMPTEKTERGSEVSTEVTVIGE